MDVKWSPDQIRSILKAVLMRVTADPTEFKIETGNTSEAKFSNYKNGQSIYIVVKSNYIYISIDAHSGSYEPASWWWQDKEIKEYVRELLNLAATNGITSHQLVVKAFPEIVSEEFERQVLGAKDGKSES